MFILIVKTHRRKFASLGRVTIIRYTHYKVKKFCATNSEKKSEQILNIRNID